MSLAVIGKSPARTNKQKGKIRMQKLYIIVRADLDAGLLLAQACHAVSAFAVAHPARHAAWHTGGRNIVVLAAPDAPALAALLARAAAVDVDRAEFYEADLAGELTAIAVAYEAKRFVSALPLALKRPALAA